MDKDRLIGAGKQFAGAQKEAGGTLAGDAKPQVDGEAEKNQGKAQYAVSGLKDTLKK